MQKFHIMQNFKKGVYFLFSKGDLIMLKFAYLFIFGSLVTSCNRFERELTPPLSMNLAESIEGESDFEGGLDLNIGYLTVYDHPTIQLQEGAQFARYMDFTFSEKPSVASVECDASSPDSPNINEVASEGDAGPAAKTLSFRKLSIDNFFRWKNWTLKQFVVDEFTYETVDENNVKTTIPLTLTSGLVDLKFGYFDPNKKLVEGSLNIIPLKGESAFSFTDSSETIYTGSTFTYNFVIKYCADLTT